jgi:uncharacterized membrane protein YjgN (DUF898 family)
LQYFYRHTELAGSSFDFHGSPKRILIGRVIAFVMLLAYNFCVRLQSIWTLVIIVALAAVLPWLLRNSFRFRLYNTSRRGTRFHLLLMHNGMSPGLLADSLKKLLASHPDSSKAGYLSSHPSTDERMRHLRQLAASFNGK